MNTYVPIFRGLDARGGRKLRTDTHTNTRDNYSNPRCAHARRGLINKQRTKTGRKSIFSSCVHICLTVITLSSHSPPLFIHPCRHAHTHTHARAHAHTHAHTHTHTHTCSASACLGEMKTQRESGAAENMRRMANSAHMVLPLPVGALTNTSSSVL